MQLVVGFVRFARVAVELFGRPSLLGQGAVPLHPGKAGPVGALGRVVAAVGSLVGLVYVPGIAVPVVGARRGGRGVPALAVAVRSPVKLL